jgi:hypothetical protein
VVNKTGGKKMKKNHEFLFCADRYRFDFNECTTGNGYAQVDTGSDASYFGIWANPFTLTTVSFVEGDVYRNTAENEQEFIEELHNIRDFHNENDKFKGIDPGFNEALKARFIDLGLKELLH